MQELRLLMQVERQYMIGLSISPLCTARSQNGGFPLLLVRKYPVCTCRSSLHSASWEFPHHCWVPKWRTSSLIAFLCMVTQTTWLDKRSPSLLDPHWLQI